MENEVLYLTIGKVVSLNALAQIKFMLTCHGQFEAQREQEH